MHRPRLIVVAASERVALQDSFQGSITQSLPLVPVELPVVIRVALLHRGLHTRRHQELAQYLCGKRPVEVEQRIDGVGADGLLKKYLLRAARYRIPARLDEPQHVGLAL